MSCWLSHSTSGPRISNYFIFLSNLPTPAPLTLCPIFPVLWKHQAAGIPVPCCCALWPVLPSRKRSPSGLVAEVARHSLDTATASFNPAPCLWPSLSVCAYAPHGGRQTLSPLCLSLLGREALASLPALLCKNMLSLEAGFAKSPTYVANLQLVISYCAQK